MFYNISLIIISLEVLTIIHHGLSTEMEQEETSIEGTSNDESAQKELAQKECENLMVEFWYTDKSISGKINFINTYYDLTNHHINRHFNALFAKVDDDLSGKRFPQKRLYIQYYFELINNHGVDLNKLLPVNIWCKFKVKKEMKIEMKYHPVLFEFRFEKCIQLIKDTFGIDETRKPYYILDSFYTNWTHKELLRVSDDGASSSQTREADTDINNFAVKNYPQLFFEYYCETISEGNFKTIEEFCHDHGYRILQSENIYY